MNAVVGIATGRRHVAHEMRGPILWEQSLFFKNYYASPILGPTLGVGDLSPRSPIDDRVALASAAPGQGSISEFRLVEGETVTPMLLARQFTLNPVLVILSLVFSCWMSGIPGAILSVPMLAIIKIICDRVQAAGGAWPFSRSRGRPLTSNSGTRFERCRLRPSDDGSAHRRQRCAQPNRVTLRTLASTISERHGLSRFRAWLRSDARCSCRIGWQRDREANPCTASPGSVSYAKHRGT